MKSDLRRLVELLFRDNETNSGIGRKLGKHRDTVGRMRTKLGLSGLTEQQCQEMSDDELSSVFGPTRRKNVGISVPDFDALILELRKPAKNKVHLFKGYVQQVESDPESKLRPMKRSKFYQELRDRHKSRGLEYRHIHQPGACMQFDFTGKKPFYIDKNGQKCFAEMAVSILPYSNLIFAVALHSQNLRDTVTAFVKTLEYFQAVPRDAVFDNFKAAVTTPRRGSKPAVINRHFRAMLDHYSVFPDPARVFEARDKGAVENAVKIIEADFIGAERFLGCSSLKELNTRLLTVVNQLNDRPMPTYQNRSRREIYTADERPHMRPLPAMRYEYGEWQEEITVPLHYHVRIGATEYSVPHRIAGSKVNIKVTSQAVEVHSAGILVAVHAIADEATRRVTSPEHLPDNHLAMTGDDQESVLERARRLGSIVLEFVEKHLEIHSNRKAARDMCKQFERKIQHYGRSTFFDAIREAIEREQITAKAVYSLLDRPRPLIGDDDTDAAPHPSGNIRGPRYYDEEED